MNHSTIVIKVESHLKRFKESDFPGGNSRDNNPMTDAVETVFHDAVNVELERFITDEGFKVKILRFLEDGDVLPRKVDKFSDLGTIKISIERTEKEIKILPLTDDEILACDHQWDLITCTKCGCKVMDYRNAYNKKHHKGLNTFM